VSESKDCLECCVTVEHGKEDVTDVIALYYMSYYSMEATQSSLDREYEHYKFNLNVVFAFCR
jgi:hypothetical protein